MSIYRHDTEMMNATGDARTESFDQWRSLCEKLSVLGETLSEEPYPTDPRSRTEGIAHLADQLVCWLAWTTEHQDPRNPRFHRHNDLISQWGGPNYDNVYRHAPIDPASSYRISGSMHGCDEFLLALRSGFMHTANWGTLATITASELGIGPGDDFEILLGGPDGVEIPDGVVMASVREYYYGWNDEPAAEFSIECLDPGIPQERDEATLAAQLDDAGALIESSTSFWNNYLVEARAERSANSFANPVAVAKGLSVANYRFCFWELDSDESLIIDSDVPDATYYSFQLYSLGWFEPLDIENRITSRNQTQLEILDDRIRVVLGPTDSGAANWLDTGGRSEGLCILRWFWPNGEATVPEPTVNVADPTDLPDRSVTPAEREAELAARRRHLSRRFAT